MPGRNTQGTIMKTIKHSLALTMAMLLAVQPLLVSGAFAVAPDATQAVAAGAASDTVELQPRELTGFLDDRRAEYRAAPRPAKDRIEAEENAPLNRSPLLDLPVIDDKLTSKTERVAGDETLRVIVHLDYLPHAAVLENTLARHKTAVDRLETDRRSHLARMATKRDSKAKTDSANYAAMRSMNDAERQELADLHERNEALSAVIKQETTQQLRELIEPYQASVVDAIEKLGGNVEFTMIAGNTLVATLEAQAVAELAKIPGVMRVVEDSIMEGHLVTADTSSMVDPSDASLLGLWDNAQDGGIYDPAVIDSGTDLQNPLVIDDANRSNWCSWYLVAANGSANFDDIFSCDDMQGHGTHVYGIVGSHGSALYQNHLGMAKGVEKMVSLKAGWLNSSNGRASMFWSDKYNLVERALNNTAALGGPGAYADDVEGFNLSYGGETTLDDTDGGRFWDSVVHSIADLTVTISAATAARPTSTSTTRRYPTTPSPWPTSTTSIRISAATTRSARAARWAQRPVTAKNPISRRRAPTSPRPTTNGKPRPTGSTRPVRRWPPRWCSVC